MKATRYSESPFLCDTIALTPHLMKCFEKSRVLTTEWWHSASLFFWNAYPTSGVHFTLVKAEAFVRSISYIILSKNYGMNLQ